MEEAVRHFFVEWNVKVYEARALATEAGGGGVTLTAKLQKDGAATWMARHKAMVVADSRAAGTGSEVIGSSAGAGGGGEKWRSYYKFIN